ncbi:hypothetical protein S40285_05092 [Stachybotrys chlorohalonatus IBT 40285]|uniref:alpha-1,2-Mannosidase n=1 Tax=Stachybotrys chlorohalonatus (strain IBT 40285) TaxID=1283841 RepID=A0A084QQI6_STAC4|nr:hypothetical protein S40285_05092 [Stachybotrys chlorohalonata IBT 40285]
MLRRFIRLGRRYALVFALALAFTIAWRTYGFWVLLPRFLTPASRSFTVGDITYTTSSYDWAQAPIHHPVQEILALPVGPPLRLPRTQARFGSETQDEVAEARKGAIKAKFDKSWQAYKKHAWPKDALKPLSAKGAKSLSGWSAQMVDALDTLWIMDMKDDFYAAVRVIARIDWSRTSNWSIDVFEVIIRYLGGLLAAYDLSGEAVLLAKAVELGDTLYAAFDTPNRMPVRWLNYGKAIRGRSVAQEKMSGAAGSTLCLEFTRLSQLTGDPKYYDATERVKQFLKSWQPKTKIPGIWPITMNWRDGIMAGQRFSIGAGMDSLYEYLPKMYAILGGLDADYKEMTLRAFDTVRRLMLFRPMTPTNDKNLLMAGVAVAANGGKPRLVGDMQHLACFAGGTYALAGKLLSRDDYIETGARLARGCVWAYSAFPTGIMPEKANMAICRTYDGPCAAMLPKDRNHALPVGFMRMIDSRYILRPEAIESVFYLWRITGDQEWRDVAWIMWEAIVRETETETAFAAIEDVREPGGPKLDEMETFWMGETLKYFYLIFEDASVLNLDEWVLNTEAHPLRRPMSNDEA